jgi:transcriptional regulator with XRE-family HTH domain
MKLALRRTRVLLGLRQFDIAAATGVSLGKISAAERGAAQFSEKEQQMLRAFLQERCQLIQRLEKAPIARLRVDPEERQRN